MPCDSDSHAVIMNDHSMVQVLRILRFITLQTDLIVGRPIPRDGVGWNCFDWNSKEMGGMVLGRLEIPWDFHGINSKKVY